MSTVNERRMTELVKAAEEAAKALRQISITLAKESHPSNGITYYNQKTTPLQRPELPSPGDIIPVVLDWMTPNIEGYAYVVYDHRNDSVKIEIELLSGNAVMAQDFISAHGVEKLQLSVLDR